MKRKASTEFEAPPAKRHKTSHPAKAEKKTDDKRAGMQAGINRAKKHIKNKCDAISPEELMSGLQGSFSKTNLYKQGYIQGYLNTYTNKALNKIGANVKKAYEDYLISITTVTSSKLPIEHKTANSESPEFFESNLQTKETGPSNEPLTAQQPNTSKKELESSFFESTRKKTEDEINAEKIQNQMHAEGKTWFEIYVYLKVCINNKQLSLPSAFGQSIRTAGVKRAQTFINGNHILTEEIFSNLIMEMLNKQGSALYWVYYIRSYLGYCLKHGCQIDDSFKKKLDSSILEVPVMSNNSDLSPLEDGLAHATENNGQPILNFMESAKKTGQKLARRHIKRGDYAHTIENIINRLNPGKHLKTYAYIKAYISGYQQIYEAAAPEKISDKLIKDYKNYLNKIQKKNTDASSITVIGVSDNFNPQSATPVYSLPQPATPIYSHLLINSGFFAASDSEDEEQEDIFDILNKADSPSQ